MRNKVLFFLLISFFIFGSVPMFINYFMVSDILSSQQKIYRSHGLSESLSEFESLLKKSSKIEPDKEKQYRAQFDKVQNLKVLYGEDSYFSDTVQAAMFKYFFIVFILTMFFVFGFGFLLNIQIHRVYTSAFDQLVKEKERNQYLNNIAKWKSTAQMLAHEIRRPLQPMKMWLSLLRKESNTPSTLDAVEALEQESLFLNDLVGGFSSFADLPRPEPRTVRLSQVVNSFISQYQNIWPTIRFQKLAPVENDDVALDTKLFRTLLSNLVENAAEANKEKAIEMQFKIELNGQSIALDVFNTGIALEENDRQLIFDMHFSTKLGGKNRGLGLAIVKTIILEHGGEIECLASSHGVRFKIQLPQTKGATG